MMLSSDCRTHDSTIPTSAHADSLGRTKWRRRAVRARHSGTHAARRPGVEPPGRHLPDIARAAVAVPWDINSNGLTGPDSFDRVSLRSGQARDGPDFSEQAL